MNREVCKVLSIESCGKCWLSVYRSLYHDTRYRPGPRIIFLGIAESTVCAFAFWELNGKSGLGAKMFCIEYRDCLAGGAIEHFLPSWHVFRSFQHLVLLPVATSFLHVPIPRMRQPFSFSSWVFPCRQLNESIDVVVCLPKMCLFT